MDDIKLLGVARQYERLLTKLHNGEIQKSIDDAVKSVHEPRNKDNPTCVANAQIMLTIGKIIFGWSMDEMIKRLEELN